MLEVRRKKNESFDALLRRFSSSIKMSGKLLNAKRNRFLQPRVNKRLQKVKALRSLAITQHIEYLKRTGKYKEDMPKHRLIKSV